MTTTPKVLFESKLAEAVETTQYTSDNCKTAIDKLTATNISGTVATITVHLVPPDGAPDSSNAFVKHLVPAQTWPFSEIVGHNMEAGSKISTIAGAANAISIRASGRQFT